MKALPGRPVPRSWRRPRPARAAGSPTRGRVAPAERDWRAHPTTVRPSGATGSTRRAARPSRCWPGKALVRRPEDSTTAPTASRAARTARVAAALPKSGRRDRPEPPQARPRRPELPMMARVHRWAATPAPGIPMSGLRRMQAAAAARPRSGTRPAPAPQPKRQEGRPTKAPELTARPKRALPTRGSRPPRARRASPSHRPRGWPLQELPPLPSSATAERPPSGRSVWPGVRASAAPRSRRHPRSGLSEPAAGPEALPSSCGGVEFAGRRSRRRWRIPPG
jgi:hypothetical protein